MEIRIEARVGELRQVDADVIAVRGEGAASCALVPRSRGIATAQVVFVGVDRPAFSSRDEIREFARSMLRGLRDTAPHVRELALTVHGLGVADPADAVWAQVEGLVAAIRRGEAPARLEAITIVDGDPRLVPLVEDAAARALDDTHPEPVVAPGPASADAGFDVFLSYKSDDTAHAKQVCDFLRSSGLRVFFSRESLPQLGSDDYHREIDRALEGARHLVVVTASRESAMSQWVEYEWRLFLGEKLAGRKAGNLVTVIAGAMTIGDLPISLRNREVVRLPDELPKLLDYTRAAGS